MSDAARNASVFRLARARIGAIAALLIPGLIAGCASKQSLPSETSGTIHPGEGSLRAAELIRFSRQAVEFVKVDPASRAQLDRATRTRSETTEHGAEWREAEGEGRVEYWREPPEGGVAMTASLEHKDNALALFDPPFVLLPETLAFATPFTSEAAMRVVSAEHPETQREQGTGRGTVEWVGDEWIETIAGRFDCHRLEVTFVADLRMAVAETKSIRWYARGIGLVAEERTRQVTILGVLGPPTLERWERAGAE